jgi:hypothetical protein
MKYEKIKFILDKKKLLFPDMLLNRFFFSSSLGMAFIYSFRNCMRSLDRVRNDEQERFGRIMLYIIILFHFYHLKVNVA